MFRCFLFILLVISACAVIAQNVLVYQFNAVYYLVDEKETSDDKQTGTDAEEYRKEKIISFSGFLEVFAIKDLCRTILNSLIKCSKGFFNQRYNPPEGS